MSKTKMKLRYAVTTTAGSVRAVNEDNFYLNGTIKPEKASQMEHSGETSVHPAVFSVADGLGGEGNGEQAAYIAVSILNNYHSTFQETYPQYLNNANKQICDKQEKAGSRMGCTSSALYVKGEQAISVNLGDSRIYQFRNGQLKLLSKDHSEYAVMLQYGVMTEEDYYTTDKRNRLTRYLGNPNITSAVEPYVNKEITVQAGDIFLLCSDGFCGSVRPQQIIELLERKETLQERCRAMADTAMHNGSDDNITVMLIEAYQRKLELREISTESIPADNKQDTVCSEKKRNWLFGGVFTVGILAVIGVFLSLWISSKEPKNILEDDGVTLNQISTCETEAFEEYLTSESQDWYQEEEITEEVSTEQSFEEDENDLIPDLNIVVDIWNQKEKMIRKLQDEMQDSEERKIR